MSVRASVIVNNYNYARYLPEAVESALAQTYPHTEVVVVDDGSTDHSRALLAGYGDRIRLVLQENRGQASAFNTGFAASRGEVVLFLDADDRLLPTAVETAVRHLEDPGVVKVHWSLCTIDAEGRPLGGLYPGKPLGHGGLREHVIRNGPNSYVNPPTSGNAWPRWYLEQVLPVRDSGDRHGADAYLFCLAPLFGQIRVSEEPQSLYRLHGSNFSGRTLGDRVARDLRRHDFLCEILAEQCLKEGVPVNPEQWKGPGTYYSWMEGLRMLHQELERRVGVDEGFILVDEDQWGTESQVLGRRRFPFIEREGRYWGAPTDDRCAVAEVERLRNAGAGWMAFAGHTFWWLEHYAGLRHHLRAHYRCALESDRLLLFDLRPELQPTGANVTGVTP